MSYDEAVYLAPHLCSSHLQVLQIIYLYKNQESCSYVAVLFDPHQQYFIRQLLAQATCYSYWEVD